MADLEIDFDDMEDELEKLSKAISVFEPYSKNFISNTKESFHGFNSDFISELEEALDNMRDTKAPQLVKNLKAFEENVRNLLEDFQDVDHKIGNTMKKKGR